MKNAVLLAGITLAVIYTGIARPANIEPVSTPQQVDSLEAEALQGNPKLQLKLASMFMHGNGGVAVDAERAIYWYTIAAEQDIAYAQHKLAQIYLQQERINQNIDTALYWLRRAAKLGFVAAQLDLSRLYTRGDGVPQDLVSAYMWLGIAESLAELDIEARQTELADRMSYLQLARAKFLTRKCILQQYRDC